MKVSLIQVASPSAEPVEERRERVGQLVRSARGADLIVLPELWPVGYSAFESYAAEAEASDGPTVTAAQGWARELNCHVHLGSFIETTADGRHYNTAMLIDPTGKVIHTYRKMHVFGYQSLEATLLTPGDGISVTDTAFGPLSATTCYDLRFPELWREIVDAGAHCVIVPAAWPGARREHWRIFTSCRAIEEQVFIVACNAVGFQDGHAPFGGHSRIVSPWGDVLIEADDTEGVFSAEVDMNLVQQTRTEFPVLADRR